MRSKHVLYIFTGIILLVCMISAVYKLTAIPPQIIITAQIGNISEKAYKEMHSTEKIEKFKEIRVNVKAIEPLGVTKHIKIESDLFNKYLKNNDKIEIYSDSRVACGDGKQYIESMEICLKDLSKDELINLMSDCKYKVLWKNFGNNSDSKILYLKDYIK